MNNTCCHGYRANHTCCYGYPLCIACLSVGVSVTASAVTPARPSPSLDSGETISNRALLSNLANKHRSFSCVCVCVRVCIFRYRCMKCVNIHVCQSCFLTERQTRKHKTHHPVLEFCTQVNKHRLTHTGTITVVALCPSAHLERDSVLVSAQCSSCCVTTAIRSDRG